MEYPGWQKHVKHPCCDHRAIVGEMDLELVVDDGEVEQYVDLWGILGVGEQQDLEVGEESRRGKKRARVGTCAANFADVSIRDSLFAESVRSVCVVLEYHSLEECDFIVVVSWQGTRLFKWTLPKDVGGGLRELLSIVHHKCLSEQLKRSRQKGMCGASDGAWRQVSKGYKEVVCPQVALDVDREGHWRLTFQLLLRYTPQVMNRFSVETSRSLDLLFARPLTGVPSPPSPFIQKEFIAQVVAYTNERLAAFPPGSLVVPGLGVKLLPFQYSSVQWMLEKESASLDELGEDNVLHFLNSYVSFGYEKISPTVFWNKFTNFIITRDEVQQIHESLLRKSEGAIIGAQGLLSEEMGLGKTIEILSLILLNKRQTKELETFIANDGKTIYKSKVSLIICPNAILQQWIDEIECHTLRSLRIFYYKGYQHVKKFFETENITEIVRSLADYDIIITSYNVVSTEVHYAEYNASLRPRRTISPIKYDYSSPLSLLQFFRIILDEVQMLQSDSTNAAKCTSLLHRVHTWGVSGTPIQLVRDYQIVLSYLKISPFHELPEIISTINSNIIYERPQMVNGARFSLQELMGFFINRDLCIRHSKKDVLDQIKIPKQQNYIVPLDFAPVEWDNYLDLWNHFIMTSGYNPDGSGSTRLSTTQLNQWLGRLRYLCCHAIFPESSSLSKSHPSNANSIPATLHSIDDVLQMMINDANDKLDSLYRDDYQLLIKSAQVNMELENKPVEAIELLQTIKNKILQDLKSKYNVIDPFESAEIWHNRGTSRTSTPAVASSVGPEGENNVRVRIRAYLDLLHQCYFFVATGHFFLGSSKLEKVDHENEKLALRQVDEKPKTYSEVYSPEEMNEIEKNQLLEQEYYTYAERLREKILFSRVEKVAGTIKETKTYLEEEKNGEVVHPSSLRIIDFDGQHDYSSNTVVSRCFKQLGLLIGSLNAQATQFNELFGRLHDLLYKPIYKDYTKENEDDKAQEYSSSIDDQDQLFALFACMEQLLANRDTVLTSEENIKVNKKSTKPQPGQKFSDYHRKLISKLKLITGLPIKPVFDELNNSKIVRNILPNPSGRNRQEAFEDYLLQFEEQSMQMTEENKRMRDSLRRLNAIYNAKLEYYSHLQKISDSLISLLQLETPARNSILKAVRDGSRHKANLERISMAESRVKYLTSLEKLKTSIDNHQTFSCPICLGKITLGSIIKCGHFFCRKCIHSWLKNHSSCPMCKITTSSMELYNFKFQNDTGDAEEPQSESGSEAGKNRQANGTIKVLDGHDLVFKQRYSIFPQMKEVYKMVIKESYGAKIDFVVRLTLFLKLKAETENEKEPLQIVLYSQSSDYLKIIAKVLQMHEIRSISCLANSANVGESILRFKKHRSITCLLLNVKALGAGLTLLNARHIFLLDAIINRGDELQAMGRNNRIGQTHETFVWNFMMRNSVEENIFKYKCILEGRRKELEGEQNSSQEGPEDFTGEKEREELEMNESTGEQVSARHLWHCFFQDIETP